MRFRITLVVALFALVAIGYAQSQPGQDSTFQVRYAANLAAGESYINIINTGANGAPLQGPGYGPDKNVGNICVNVYTFAPDEQLISCCSCLVTANQVVNLGVNRDLVSKTLTGVVPSSVTVKLLATKKSSGDTTSCSNSAADPSQVLTWGMAAFGTTLHSQPGGGFATTETQFTPASLSEGELASIRNRCANIIGNGSGYGICASCRLGALGAVRR